MRTLRWRLELVKTQPWEKDDPRYCNRNSLCMSKKTPQTPCLHRASVQEYLGPTCRPLISLEQEGVKGVFLNLAPEIRSHREAKPDHY